MFHSVITENESSAPERAEAPEYFRDLHLDQVVNSITAAFDAYDLNRFYYARLLSVDTVAYRHETMRDIDDPTTFSAIARFTERMRQMREELGRADKLKSEHQKQRWFLQAVQTYVGAICSLNADLTPLPLRSRALLGLREYTSDYCLSSSFGELRSAADQREAELDSIRYTVHIRGTRVTVDKYEGEPDYSSVISNIFQKFQQHDGKIYDFSVAEQLEMNHVETQILEIVAALYPEIFGLLEAFYDGNQEFADKTLLRFDREIHFYIAYKTLISELGPLKLDFCYPSVTERGKATHGTASFDLALAIAPKQSGEAVVPNDWSLDGKERILIVSGPNQGGKTTFARMIGQVHHLAAVGLPVPGSAVQVALPDAIFTHFERGENVIDRRGKLQDDLLRIHDISTRATERSLVIINEIFNSTALRDALFLAGKILDILQASGALCVCVTFLDELSRRGDETVSMVSSVDPHDLTKRTFKILRAPADGRAYALSLAEAHGLTHQVLKGRIPA